MLDRSSLLGPGSSPPSSKRTINEPSFFSLKCLLYELTNFFKIHRRVLRNLQQLVYKAIRLQRNCTIITAKAKKLDKNFEVAAKIQATEK